MERRPRLGPQVAWMDSPPHRAWLAAEEDRLVRLHYRASRRSEFGHAVLSRDGLPDGNAVHELYAVARHVHCFALEWLRGVPGAFRIAERGVTTLLERFRDGRRGGFYDVLAPDGSVISDRKTGYGHAFALLAGATALVAGIPGARDLLGSADAAIDEHFWRESEGAIVDGFTADWHLEEPDYRGQNANMHLAEAYMAAFEATGRAKYRRRAQTIAELIVATHAAAHQWRIPEHFDAAWSVRADFGRDRTADPIRPHGSIVGHWLEWARLVLQLDALPGSAVPWASHAAENLFARAVQDGWDGERGGLLYRVELNGEVLARERCHWVMAEAIGASVYLARLVDGETYGRWYRNFWSYVADRLIDDDGGSWWHQIDEDGRPIFTVWSGKPDLYHALQATLYARMDLRYGLAEGARRGSAGVTRRLDVCGRQP